MTLATAQPVRITDWPGLSYQHWSICRSVRIVSGGIYIWIHGPRESLGCMSSEWELWLLLQSSKNWWTLTWRRNSNHRLFTSLGLGRITRLKERANQRYSTLSNGLWIRGADHSVRPTDSGNFSWPAAHAARDRAVCLVIGIQCDWRT